MERELPAARNQPGVDTRCTASTAQGGEAGAGTDSVGSEMPPEWPAEGGVLRGLIRSVTGEAWGMGSG